MQCMAMKITEERVICMLLVYVTVQGGVKKLPGNFPCEDSS